MPAPITTALAVSGNVRAGSDTALPLVTDWLGPLIYHSRGSEEHPANRSLEVVDVVPHDPLGRRPVARHDRLEQGPVLEHSLFELARLLQCEEPDSQGEQVVLLERRDEEL